jgi:hypothetical protein
MMRLRELVRKINKAIKPLAPLTLREINDLKLACKEHGTWTIKRKYVFRGEK